jgi:hypothetical protein
MGPGPNDAGCRCCAAVVWARTGAGPLVLQSRRSLHDAHLSEHLTLQGLTPLSETNLLRLYGDHLVAGRHLGSDSLAQADTPASVHDCRSCVPGHRLLRVVGRAAQAAFAESSLCAVQPTHDGMVRGAFQSDELAALCHPVNLIGQIFHPERRVEQLHHTETCIVQCAGGLHSRTGAGAD